MSKLKANISSFAGILIGSTIMAAGFVFFINPYNFVPHRPEFFADLRLHPNDFGFGLYAKGVYNEMVKHL